MTWGRALRSIFVCLAACVGACGGKERSRAYTTDAFAAPDASDATAEGGFAREIFPLLQAGGCAGADCHVPELRVVRHWAVTTPEATYAEWVNHPGFDHCDPNGNPITAPPLDKIRVVPGDPDNSMVLKKLTDPWEMCGPFYGHMPPAPADRLPAEQIDRIRAWIAAGAAF